MKNLFSFFVLRVGVAALICCYFLNSCSPYNRIIKRNPLTHKDSVNLAIVCSTVYPTDTLKEKTDTAYLPAKDSSNFYQSKLDSLAAIKRKDSIILQTKYKDTCTSTIDEYKHGFDLGYEVGVYNGKNNCIPDTIKIKTTTTIEDNAKIKIAQDEALKQTQTANEWKKKADTRATGEIWLAAFLLALIIAVYFVIRYLIKKKAIAN